MSQKIKNLKGMNKNLLEDIITDLFHYASETLKKKKQETKKYFLMSIKDMLINNLHRYKYVKINLIEDEKLNTAYNFQCDMLDTEILDNVYMMLQEILYNMNYKISIEYESK